MKHELKPIAPPFNPAVATILEQYPKGQEGYILKLFRVFANSLRFLGGKGIVNLLDKDSPLSLNEREIVILRVTANKNCEYEWGVHVAAFAAAAGLSEEQVAMTKLGGPNCNVWTAHQSLLIQCVDEICHHAQIQESTYEQFQKTWDLEQQLEILALCGNYHTVSFVANTARIPLEDASVPFPTKD